MLYMYMLFDTNFEFTVSQVSKASGVVKQTVILNLMPFLWSFCNFTQNACHESFSHATSQVLTLLPWTKVTAVQKSKAYKILWKPEIWMSLLFLCPLNIQVNPFPVTKS